MSEAKNNSYLARISKSKDKKDAESLAHSAEEASIQIQSDVFTMKTVVSKAAKALDSAKSTTPFDSGEVLNAAAVLADAQADLAILQELKEELFPKG